MGYHVTPYLRVARPTIGVDPLDYSAQPTLIAPHTISFCDSVTNHILSTVHTFPSRFFFCIPLSSRVAATGGFQSLPWGDRSRHSFTIVLLLTASVVRPIQALILEL